MLIKIQNHIINTDHIAQARYAEGFEGSSDKTVPSRPSMLDIDLVGGIRANFTEANADTLWRKLCYRAKEVDSLEES